MACNGFDLLKYDENITCLANSIMKYFGVNIQEKSTLQYVDRCLGKKYKNVVVILLDSLGKNILDYHFTKDSFFQRHLCKTYFSVFPPTTVAATTSIMSGLNPVEHGWIGWDTYFPQIDKNVEVFTNYDTATTVPAASYNVAWEYCPYETIFERIKNAGYQSYYLNPFVDSSISSFENLLERTMNLCSDEKRKYIYSYWSEPDGIIHKNGCFSEETRQCVLDLEKKVEEFYESVSEDTIIFITADHGHVDTNTLFFQEFTQLYDCFLQPPSLEPRAITFWVKEDKKNNFENEFRANFKNEYILLTKDEVEKYGLFGNEKNFSKISDMIGNYLAIAIGKTALCFKDAKERNYVAFHAGLTLDEMEIPLIVLKK